MRLSVVSSVSCPASQPANQVYLSSYHHLNHINHHVRRHSPSLTNRPRALQPAVRAEHVHPRVLMRRGAAVVWRYLEKGTNWEARVFHRRAVARGDLAALLLEVCNPQLGVQWDAAVPVLLALRRRARPSAIYQQRAVDTRIRKTHDQLRSRWLLVQRPGV